MYRGIQLLLNGNLAFPDALREGLVHTRKLSSFFELADPCVETTRESVELVPKWVVIFFTHWIALPLSAPVCVCAPTAAPGRPGSRQGDVGCVIPLLNGMRHLDALDARFGQDQRRRARLPWRKAGRQPCRSRPRRR